MLALLTLTFAEQDRVPTLCAVHLASRFPTILLSTSKWSRGESNPGPRQNQTNLIRACPLASGEVHQGTCVPPPGRI